MLDISNFRKKINEKSRLIGIDPGKRRIGVAICDENRKIATPLKTLEKKEFHIFKKELDSLIKEYNIDGIVIGHPLKTDGTSGNSAQSAKDLAINLSKNISLPIILWDERYSSEGAFKIIRDLQENSSKKQERLDRDAAAFILQGFIDYLNK